MTSPATPISRTDRYFNIIDRVIRLLLLLALLGLLVGALALCYTLLRSGPAKEPGMAKVEEKTVDDSKVVILGFAEAEAVHGADTDMVRLVATNRERNYSSGRGDTRNVLFVQRAGQPAHWLFNGNRNDVHVLNQLQEGPGGRTLAHYIEYTESRESDNADKPGKPVAVALVKPDGTGMKAVLRNVTRVLSHQRAGQRINVLFLRGTALWQATVSLDDFTVSGERELAKLPTSL